mmetsp:Transcript_131257/g.365816  ORF Transcript_131257/g.365816 Transcript_131257/m.365816 type:complete len:229 (+) Transcript_131257:571-1257(+)
MMQCAWSSTAPRWASWTSTATSANGGREPGAGGCSAARRHHGGKRALPATLRAGTWLAIPSSERRCSRTERGVQPAASGAPKSVSSPRTAANFRTQVRKRPAATCRKVWPRTLRCMRYASGMRSKITAKRPSACGVKTCCPLTRCSSELPLRGCSSPRSTPHAMSGGKDRRSSSAISGLPKAIASQSTEWPCGSRVLPETSPPWQMTASIVRTSPSTTARQTTSGTAR